jgi:hypothetical protein
MGHKGCRAKVGQEGSPWRRQEARAGRYGKGGSGR